MVGDVFRCWCCGAWLESRKRRMLHIASIVTLVAYLAFLGDKIGLSVLGRRGSY